MTLTELIGKYNVDDIEKGIVSNYLKVNAVAKSDHPYFKSYLNSFSPSIEFCSDIESLRHTSLADLAVDLELLIPAEDRETNGAFFTPQIIVDFIIQSIHPAEKAKVIDISCGSGAFLLGILRYYKNTYGKTISEIVSENLFGVDLLDYNVRRSKILIMLFGLSCGEVVKESSIKVECDNSLTRNWKYEYDAVIGNPPYVKFQDMRDETRDLLLSKYETTSFGTFNLYFAFFEIGHRLLKSNGTLGYITPNNYFTSLSGESLRKYFQDNNLVTRIVDFNSTKVFDVQTYTAITFLTKTRQTSIEYARIKHGQSVGDFLDSASYTTNPYSELNIKKWRLLCDNERAVISRVESAGDSIGKLFNIAVGIATLKDEAFFILPYKEDKDFYYCNNKYSSSFAVEKSVTRPLVKISTIKEPNDLLLNQRRIIFPYIIKNGAASAISEADMKKRFPKCYEYLVSVREVLKQRGKGKHEYSPFFAYGRTQGLNKHGIKVYTPTFSQYPRFIFDDNRDSLFTNGYALFYNESDNGDFGLFAPEHAPITYEENHDVLIKILNSGLMHFYVSRTSVSIEGGYPCYQKNFIEKFTIPEISVKDINQLRALSSQEEIDAFLLNLYQINFPAPNLWE